MCIHIYIYTCACVRVCIYIYIYAMYKYVSSKSMLLSFLRVSDSGVSGVCVCVFGFRVLDLFMVATGFRWHWQGPKLGMMMKFVLQFGFSVLEVSRSAGNKLRTAEVNLLPKAFNYHVLVYPGPQPLEAGSL